MIQQAAYEGDGGLNAIEWLRWLARVPEKPYKARWNEDKKP